MFLEKRLELCFGNEADLLRGDRAVTKEKQSRDTADVEFGWCLGILVDVELDDAELVFVLGGNGVENRGDHLAWATPFGPEVEQHGLFRFHDVLLKSRVSRMYDLTHKAESSDFLPPAGPLWRIGESR